MLTLVKRLEAFLARLTMTTEQDEAGYESNPLPSDQKTLLLLGFAEIVHGAYIT